MAKKMTRAQKSRENKKRWAKSKRTGEPFKSVDGTSVRAKTTPKRKKNTVRSKPAKRGLFDPSGTGRVFYESKAAYNRIRKHASNGVERGLLDGTFPVADQHAWFLDDLRAQGVEMYQRNGKIRFVEEGRKKNPAAKKATSKRKKNPASKKALLPLGVITASDKRWAIRVKKPSPQQLGKFLREFQRWVISYQSSANRRSRENLGILDHGKTVTIFSDIVGPYTSAAQLAEHLLWALENVNQRQSRPANAKVFGVKMKDGSCPYAEVSDKAFKRFRVPKMKRYSDAPLKRADYAMDPA
jgi:hypothetical protein